eukprot:gene8358-5853_t
MTLLLMYRTLVDLQVVWVEYVYLKYWREGGVFSLLQRETERDGGDYTTGNDYERPSSSSNKWHRSTSESPNARGIIFYSCFGFFPSFFGLCSCKSVLYRTYGLQPINPRGGGQTTLLFPIGFARPAASKWFLLVLCFLCRSAAGFNDVELRALLAAAVPEAPDFRFVVVVFFLASPTYFRSAPLLFCLDLLCNAFCAISSVEGSRRGKKRARSRGSVHLWQFIPMILFLHSATVGRVCALTDRALFKCMKEAFADTNKGVALKFRLNQIPSTVSVDECSVVHRLSIPVGSIRDYNKNKPPRNYQREEVVVGAGHTCCTHPEERWMQAPPIAPHKEWTDKKKRAVYRISVPSELVVQRACSACPSSSSSRAENNCQLCGNRQSREEELGAEPYDTTE